MLSDLNIFKYILNYKIHIIDKAKSKEAVAAYYKDLSTADLNRRG